METDHSFFHSWWRSSFLLRSLFPYESLGVPPSSWKMVAFLLTHYDFSVYTYASGLERGAPRFALPGDFTVYLIFVCTVIMVSFWITPSRLFKPSAQCITIQKIENNLSLHFVYIASRCLEQSTIAPHHICPPSFPSWSGSWKWGRSTLHFVQSHIYVNSGAVCGAGWWDDQLR